MMLAAGERRLVASGPAADVEALDEPHRLEQLERPVDGRDADLAAAGAQLVGDLASAQHAVLVADQLEHGRARCARRDGRRHEGPPRRGRSSRRRAASGSRRARARTSSPITIMVLMLDPFELPFMQRAALEVALLAPLAGVLGAQIVLRRLAFFTHGVGDRGVPGPRRRRARRDPAGARGAGGRRRLRRRPRARSTGGRGLAGATRRPALLLVAALAIGIVLASDVFASGAGVDRLLFGSLLAIGDAELLVDAPSPSSSSPSRRRASGAPGSPPASTSRAAAALGLRTGARRAASCSPRSRVAAIAAIDAVGALLVSAVLVVPAATARLFAGSVRELEIGARRRSRWRRDWRGSWSPTSSMSRPAPSSRCSAASSSRLRCSPVRSPARRARSRGRRRERGGDGDRRPRPRAAATRPAGRSITGLDFTVPAGSMVAVLGPNGGGKTTLFRALLGELPQRSGTVAVAGTVAYVPQTERYRLDFPVSALDVVLMGDLRTHALVPAARAASRGAGAAPRSSGSGSRERAERPLRRALRRAAPAGADRPRARPGRARAPPRRAAQRRRPALGASGSSRSSASSATRARDAARLEPRHRTRRARFDAVLCINGRQVFHGPPEADHARDPRATPTAASSSCSTAASRRSSSSTTPLTDDRLAHRAASTGDRPARAARAADPRRRLRAARRLDRAATGRATRPSRSPTRCCPASSSRRLLAIPLGHRRRRRARGRGGLHRGSHRASTRSAPTSPSRSRSRPCSAPGTLLALSPAGPGPARRAPLRRPARRLDDRPASPRRPSRVARRSLALAGGHRSLTLSGFDPQSAPSLGGEQRREPPRCCSGCWR